MTLPTQLSMLGALVVVAFALVGSILVLRRFRRGAPEKVALAARVAAMRPFAEAAVGEEVKIEGIVSLLDGACVEGPVLEQPGVWVEAEILEEPDPDSATLSLTRVRAVVPFSVSGVRVHPPERPMEWPLTSLVTQRDSQPVATPAERVRAFFAAHGVVVDEYCIPGRKVVFRERCLKPGVAILVMGTKVRGTTAPRSPTGYRDVREPPPELAGSAFYESEAAIALEAKPDPWNGVHAVVFVSAFVAIASLLGTIEYVVLAFVLVG